MIIYSGHYYFFILDRNVKINTHGFYAGKRNLIIIDNAHIMKNEKTIILHIIAVFYKSSCILNFSDVWFSYSQSIKMTDSFNIFL